MDLPSVCPVCGGWSITQEGEASVLLAVCDVLVVQALRTLGKRIVRADRHRYVDKGNRPWHVCHTVWAPDDGMVSKALAEAWDVVPALLAAHGPCTVAPRAVTALLDAYTHDLAITGTAHSLPELAYRFQTRLGLPVYLKDRAPCYA